MTDILDNLNAEQKKAIVHEDGPLLILAGAGSGKTRVLTHRVAYLVREKMVDPEEILLLTFTNKAAGEMKERVGKLLESGCNLGFAGTFHTFGARMMRTLGYVVGVKPNFVIYDAEDSESLMKEVVKSMGLDPKESKPRMLLALIGKMKNDLVSIEEAELSARDLFYKQLVKVWKEYQKRLQKNNALDFDDLLVKTVDLLKVERIRKEINERWKWVLIDEYQDTNKAQFELTRLLTGEAGNITVVGDAAQAIYSFRGADFRNLVLLENEYPTLTTISLPRNYRSTQVILDAAFGVIKNNTGHPVIELEADGDKGEKVDLYEALDERDEARYVVGGCKKLIDKDEEVVVLYRTNAQSRSFEDELMKKNIPYKLVGGLRFYNRAEIKDMIAYLRLVVNSEDEISAKRVDKIGKRRRDNFLEWLNKEDKVESITPDRLLLKIIEVTKYDDRFDRDDESDMARIENINELIAVASEYNSLESFLENAALSESEIKQNDSLALITLMTIHAAKGLEFDNVYVVGLEEGLFPHSRTLMSREEIEEERRLLYVAMTRAKKHLTVSFARNRLMFGGRQSPFPSRFLAEIPEKLIKKIGGVREIKKREIKEELLDDFGEKKRIIVQDWEVEMETKDDFAEIDNW